jgi:hypothetical protein
MNEIQKKDAILQTPFQVSDNPDVILLTVVQDAVKEMNRKGYAPKTIEDYVRTWKQLLTYAERVNEKYCIKELLIEFAGKQYGKPIYSIRPQIKQNIMQDSFSLFMIITIVEYG